MKTKLHTGSPKPKAPVSKKTQGAASAKHPTYNPSAAAAHLKGQDSACPKC